MNRKRLICAVLALVLLLPVCGFTADGAGEVAITRENVLTTATAVLYYVSEDGERLVPSFITLTLLPGETLPHAQLLALFNTPTESGAVSPFPSSVAAKLRGVECSGSIATVDLGGEFWTLSDKQLFNIKVAVVNTLTQTGELEYVNVLFNGVDMPTNGLPTGAMTRVTKDLATAFTEHQNESKTAARSSGFTRAVTLYFPDESTGLIVPEIRRISFSQDYITPILNELIRGPQTSSSLSRTLPSSARVLETPYYQFMEDGVSRYADVNLSYQYGQYLSNSEKDRPSRVGALVTSLATFVPGIAGVRIRVNRRLMEQEDAAYPQERVYTRAQFSSIRGLAVTLYLPKADGRLMPVTRTVPLNCTGAMDMVALLIQGPNDNEKELLRVYPEGFTMQQIHGVTIVNETALVNLTQEGAALLSTMDEEQERAAVFATVNTLTNLQGVRLVQFLCQNELLRGFSGRIDLRDPLLRSPGLIQQTLD